MSNTSLLKPTEPLPTEKQTSPKKNSSNKQFLGNLFVLLLIIAGAAFSIIWNQFYIAKFRTELEHSLAQLNISLKQIENQIQTDRLDNKKKIEQLVQGTAQPYVQQVIIVTAHLIRLAEFYLTTENNSAFAIQLLKIAQQSLQDAPVENMANLKNTINHDIATLSTITKPNPIDISEKLDQLKSKITELPIERKIKSPIKNEMPPPTTKNWWEKVKYNILSVLKTIFVIQPINDDPLQLSFEKRFLKENLQIKLTEAQWALINKNYSSYKKSLNSAIKMLSDDTTYPIEITSAIVKQLQILALTDINPQPPSLQSLPIINQFFEKEN